LLAGTLSALGYRADTALPSGRNSTKDIQSTEGEENETVVYFVRQTFAYPHDGDGQPMV